MNFLWLLVALLATFGAAYSLYQLSKERPTSGGDSQAP